MVPILILNEKKHQNAHERGIKWHYDVSRPKKNTFLKCLVVFDITNINFKKSSEGNPIRGNLENQPEIRNLSMP